MTEVMSPEEVDKINEEFRRALVHDSAIVIPEGQLPYPEDTDNRDEGNLNFFIEMTGLIGFEGRLNFNGEAEYIIEDIPNITEVFFRVLDMCKEFGHEWDCGVSGFLYHPRKRFECHPEDIEFAETGPIGIANIALVDLGRCEQMRVRVAPDGDVRTEIKYSTCYVVMDWIV